MSSIRSLRRSRREFFQGISGLAALPHFVVTTAHAPHPLAAQSTPSPVTDEPAIRITTSPAHGSQAASPFTTISIRGVTKDQLGWLFVMGSETGTHSGVMRDHPDGEGVSWIPDDYFAELEIVTTSADVPLSAAFDGKLRFTVSSPATRVQVETKVVTDAPVGDDPVHTFRSRPDFAPPKIKVVKHDESLSTLAVALVTPVVADGQNGLLIADIEGDPLWYHVPPDHRWSVLCLRRQPWKGEPVLTWWQGAKRLGYGFGHWIIADRSYHQIAKIQVGNGLQGFDVHDLVLTDHGTALSFSYHAINWQHEGRLHSREGILLDGVVQEVDVESGLVYWEWHSIDHIDPDEFYGHPPSDPLAAWDYVHINSIAIDDDGHVLVSCRNSWAIYKIHRETGELLWRLGGKESDFRMEQGSRFAWQHDAQRLPDGLLSLFDNHHEQQQNEALYESRGLVLDLDETNMTARVAREYLPPEGTLSVTQGNLQTCGDGSAVVGWGSAPNYSVFTADGDLLYDARFRGRTQSYRAYLETWDGVPSAPPDMAIDRNDDGSTHVFVSWNGATNVTSWRVMGGADSNDATELVRAERTGFETMLTIWSATAWMMVEALDADGIVLGKRAIPSWSGTVSLS